MKVLLVGNGGREHALAWAMAQGSDCSEVLVCPGNPGMSKTPKVRPLGGRLPTTTADFQALAKTFHEEGCAFVMVGPEVQLAAGIVDVLTPMGIPVMGPSQKATQLESSKSFSKSFMQRHDLPTARFQIVRGPSEAKAGLESWPQDRVPPVLKASELWAGKGVVVPATWPEAWEAYRNFFENPEYPVKPQELVLEERLEGREVSCFALCDGQDFFYLGEICDYKRLLDGDQGPNTGGMGAHPPREGFPSEKAKKTIRENIIPRTLEGMRAEGHPFKGVLFLGLMVNGDEVKIIEYNVRFGDPETQALMPLLAQTLDKAGLSVGGLLKCAAEGRLKDFPLHPQGADWGKNLTCVHMVLASGGYPGLSSQGMSLGHSIHVPEVLSSHAQIFYAGVGEGETGLKNTGGRVLGISAWASALEEARSLCLAEVQKVRFKDLHYRSDIGL